MRPLCPELRVKPVKSYHPIGFCNLSGHQCEVEVDPGYSCPTYNEYLESQYQEWLAEHADPASDLEPAKD